MPRSPESIERRRAACRAWQSSPAGRAYHAADRLAHPEREAARRARWKVANPDKVRASGARYAAAHLLDTTPLPALYPELNHGNAIAFWEDELRMDLAQEWVLAELEGRDPVAATNAYRARESAWRAVAGEYDDRRVA